MERLVGGGKEGFQSTPRRDLLLNRIELALVKHTSFAGVAVDELDSVGITDGNHVGAEPYERTVALVKGYLVLVEGAPPYVHHAVEVAEGGEEGAWDVVKSVSVAVGEEVYEGC